MTIRWGSVVLGALAALAVLLAIALAVILSGGYNVAATERHTTVGAWALHTNFTNSVRRQAASIEEPTTFDAAAIAAGAPEYKSMCAHCHGGVGQSPAEWAEGMQPKPPALATAAKRWSAAEVFWLVKHGAKMTGMPAFGASHDDKTIWNIAAFVKALPEMPASQYAAYPSEHPEEGAESEDGHHHEPHHPASE